MNFPLAIYFIIVMERKFSTFKTNCSKLNAAVALTALLCMKPALPSPSHCHRHYYYHCWCHHFQYERNFHTQIVSICSRECRLKVERKKHKPEPKKKIASERRCKVERKKNRARLETKLSVKMMKHNNNFVIFTTYRWILTFLSERKFACERTHKWITL